MAEIVLGPKIITLFSPLTWFSSVNFVSQFRQSILPIIFASQYNIIGEMSYWQKWVTGEDELLAKMSQTRALMAEMILGPKMVKRFLPVAWFLSVIFTGEFR